MSERDYASITRCRVGRPVKYDGAEEFDDMTGGVWRRHCYSRLDFHRKGDGEVYEYEFVGNRTKPKKNAAEQLHSMMQRSRIRKLVAKFSG